MFVKNISLMYSNHVFTRFMYVIEISKENLSVLELKSLYHNTFTILTIFKLISMNMLIFFKRLLIMPKVLDYINRTRTGYNIN